MVFRCPIDGGGEGRHFLGSGGRKGFYGELGGEGKWDLRLLGHLFNWF